MPCYATFQRLFQDKICKLDIDYSFAFVFINCIFFDGFKNSYVLKDYVEDQIEIFSQYLASFTFTHTLNSETARNMLSTLLPSDMLNETLEELNIRDNWRVKDLCLFAYFPDAVIRFLEFSIYESTCIDSRDDKYYEIYVKTLNAGNSFLDIEPFSYTVDEILECLSWIPMTLNTCKQKYALPKYNEIFDPIDTSDIESYWAGERTHEALSIIGANGGLNISMLIRPGIDLSKCSKRIANAIKQYCKTSFNYNDYKILKSQIDFSEFDMNFNLLADAVENRNIRREILEIPTIMEDWYHILTSDQIATAQDLNVIYNLCIRTFYDADIIWHKYNRTKQNRISNAMTPKLAQFILNGFNNNDLVLKYLKLFDHRYFNTQNDEATTWVKKLAIRFNLLDLYEKIRTKVSNNKDSITEVQYLDLLNNFGDYVSIEDLRVAVNLSSHFVNRLDNEQLETVKTNIIEKIYNKISWKKRVKPVINHIEGENYMRTDVYKGVNLFRKYSIADVYHYKQCDSGAKPNLKKKQKTGKSTVENTCQICYKTGNNSFNVYRACLGYINTNRPDNTENCEQNVTEKKFACSFYACLDCWKQYIDSKETAVTCPACKKLLRGNINDITEIHFYVTNINDIKHFKQFLSEFNHCLDEYNDINSTLQPRKMSNLQHDQQFLLNIYENFVEAINMLHDGMEEIRGAE